MTTFIVISVVSYIVLFAVSCALAYLYDIYRAKTNRKTKKQIQSAYISSISEGNKCLFMSKGDIDGISWSLLLLVAPAMLAGDFFYHKSTLSCVGAIVLSVVVVPFTMFVVTVYRYFGVVITEKTVYLSSLFKDMREFPIDSIQGYMNKDVGVGSRSRNYRKIYVDIDNKREEIALPSFRNDNELYALLDSLGVKNLAT